MQFRSLIKNGWLGGWLGGLLTGVSKVIRIGESLSGGRQKRSSEAPSKASAADLNWQSSSGTVAILPAIQQEISKLL